MCKCERGLKFKMEHVREATWTQHKTQRYQLNRHPSARQNQKQQIYLLGLPVVVGKKMVSLQTLFRAYSFGTFCFQQTTAEF